MSEPRKTKAFKAYNGKVLDKAQGIIETIVAVFDTVDHANERVKLGAFKKSIKDLTPKGILYHDWKRPIGKTLDIRELAPGDPLLPDEIKQYGGLYVKGQLNLQTTDGREAFSNIEMGILDEYSFGYDEIRTSIASDGVKDLEELYMYEWSPVLFGCNSKTTTISAKDHPAAPSTGAAASGNPSSASTTMEGQKNNDQGANAPGADAEQSPRTKDMATVKTKALHLGKRLEVNLVMSMLSELWWTAYWRIDAILWNWEEVTPQEQRQQLTDLFTEYTQFATKILDVLQILQQVTDTEGTKELMSEVKTKSIEGFYRKSIEAQFTATDDGSSLLAGIKSFTEMASSALKEGKPFSASNESTITEACDSLEAISQKLRDMLESAKKEISTEGGTPADPAPADTKNRPVTGGTSEKTADAEDATTASDQDGAGNVKQRELDIEIEIARFNTTTTINR